MTAVVVANQPAVTLFDAAGVELAVKDGIAIPVNTPRLLIAGTDATLARTLRTAADGTVRVDPSGTTTQPISAASLPLPAGAATEATLATLATETKLEAVRALLATIDADTSNLDVALSTRLSQTTGAAIETILTAIRDTAGVKKITDALPAGTNNIGDVDVVSSVLPAGAATEATLATLEANVATETTLIAVGNVLAAIRDTAGIKKITDALPAGTNNIGDVDVVSSALPTGAATEATLASLLTNSGDIETILTAIRDTAGIKKITDELPAGTQQIGLVAQGTKGAAANGWPFVLYDSAGNAIHNILNNAIRRLESRASITSADGVRDVSVSTDGGLNRLEINGKVVVVGASPPPATTPVAIFADTPLTVGTHSTTYTIPNGQTFRLQELSAGNEDPAKGAVVLVIFNDGSEHVVERIYTAGFSVTRSFPDVATARDGTALLGNGSNTIIVRRIKFSGSDIAIDAVVRGYVS